jgi:hypothetical protein
MFVTFFHELKSAGLPVTLREYLTLMEAMGTPANALPSRVTPPPSRARPRMYRRAARVEPA